MKNTYHMRVLKAKILNKNKSSTYYTHDHPMVYRSCGLEPPRLEVTEKSDNLHPLLKENLK